MSHFDFLNPTRLVYGAGSIVRLGTLARQMHLTRTMLVADPGMVACGYVAEARQLLAREGVTVIPFHDFSENPDTAEIEVGRHLASQEGIDSLIALGGGSSLDCAKGINFVLTGGGRMQEYWGYGKLSARTGRSMLPMIGIPTTAGTGSEAQSYALISDHETHAKMACGDPQAAFRVALLDPQLTVTMPRELTAASGYDAISHAVESYVTKKRNHLSQLYAREAWRLLEAHYQKVLRDPKDLEARGAMLLGSYFAGVAIEASMLGATHSCANPLTKNFGTAHGIAIALMLPHVVRWNAAAVDDLYGELLDVAGLTAPPGDAGERLAQRLEELRSAGGLLQDLRSIGIDRSILPILSEEASQQWTGNFNPRDWSAEGAMEVYRKAL